MKTLHHLLAENREFGTVSSTYIEPGGSITAEVAGLAWTTKTIRTGGVCDSVKKAIAAAHSDADRLNPGSHPAWIKRETCSITTARHR